jgi:transcriptional regulator with XRE-family HTH domain
MRGEVMGERGNKKDAVGILHRRYIGDDAERKASLQTERINAEVARMVCELRQDAGLTQKELAQLIGTTQSVISRLEDADYEGHSLSMLSRIAKKLNHRLNVRMVPENFENETMNYAFRELLRGLRKKTGMKIDEFASKSGIDQEEVLRMERNGCYRPTPLALHKLSKFYGIPQRRLAVLAGAVRNVPAELEQEVSRFAAQSESFAKLTPEEQQILDEFVKFLREESTAL